SATITYQVTFADETHLSSHSLANSDITLTGTAGTATSGKPTFEVSGTGPSYTVTVTAGSAEGTVGITVATGKATDGAGNASLEKSSTTSFTVDNTKPTVTIGLPSASYANSGTTVTYEVTFADETHLSSHSLANSDITLTGTAGTATSGAPTLEVSGSGPSYTVTVTAGTAEGTVGITVAAEKASDGAGNKSPEKSSTTSFEVDNTLPTVTIGSPSASYAKESATITYLVTFADEKHLSSHSLVKEDITLTGTAGTATSGTPTVEVSGTGPSYTVTVTAGSAEGAVGITVATGKAIDGAGNASLEKSSMTSFTVDNTKPTVTIGEPSASYAKESVTITYQVTFADETHLSSHSLVKEDITLTGTAGTATSGAPTVEVSGSGPSYTVTVTAGTAEGTVGITVAAEKASDGAGNKSPEKSSTTSFEVDNTLPTV
ncbi:MAG TPA: hypothetical protein VMW50_03725, partial [Dehalococcoidia bacterium]|nr:hypothetical protein [Dehalococcoidia bacterium]